MTYLSSVMNVRLSWRQTAVVASLLVSMLVNLPLLRLTSRSRLAVFPNSLTAGYSILLSWLVFHFVFTLFFIELNRYALTKKLYTTRGALAGWYTLNFVLYVLLNGLFTWLLMHWYTDHPVWYTDRPKLAFVTSYFRSFFVWLSAILIGNFLTVLQENRAMQAENALLKAQSLQAQLDGLRAQLNPHFLFNSLNALSSLIREGEPQSQRYLAKLSQVLRYSLQVQQRTLVPFAEEMQFTDAYIYLLTIRFGTNLRIENKLPEQASWQIPPMSLQLLIENAVKHNVVSTSRPLTIYLTTDALQKHIVVSNAYQPKTEPVEGMGNGLLNLDSRFRLLTGKAIQLVRTDDTFSVYLPII